MPFPATLELMFAAGYDYLRWEHCQACGRKVEVYSTPGKREIVMEPMASNSSPATRHYETCQPKEATSGRGQDTGAGRASDVTRPDGNAATDQATGRPVRHFSQHNSSAGVPDGRSDADSQIKLFGVTDPNHNLLAAGWQDGTLVCQFKTAKWAYACVPEAEFIKIRRSPFANRIFTSNIKGKFTGTKIA